VRIYFSLILVAGGGLFLSGFLCEAGFYLSTAVYASDVLGNASTCPTMHYYYFKDVLLK
jgi:hypothetical protein